VDYVVDGAVVNLAELALTIGVQVDHQATAEVVLNLDHVASHLALISGD